MSTRSSIEWTESTWNPLMNGTKIGRGGESAGRAAVGGDGRGVAEDRPSWGSTTFRVQ
jgi:protein gp37